MDVGLREMSWCMLVTSFLPLLTPAGAFLNRLINNALGMSNKDLLKYY